MYDFDDFVELVERTINLSDEELERAFQRAQFPLHVVKSWPLCDQDKYFQNLEVWNAVMEFRKELQKGADELRKRHMN